MRLSALQKYMVEVCWSVKKRVSRGFFDKYLLDKKRKRKDAVDTVTKSLENLIDKGLFIGYGVRTPKKWYIKEVALTSAGRRVAKMLGDKRQKLPLK